jgi:hypothetical protein
MFALQENYQPGLLGQPMLEDQQPAVVPVRIPARPTTNYSVTLGSWAAAAAMTLFFPDLAPVGSTPSAAVAAAPPAAARSASSSPAQVMSPIKKEQIEQGASAQASAVAPSVAVAGAGPAAAEEAQHEWLYRRYHAGVLELPAAEALHFQSQLKARLESGETAPPSDGMYLLPIELTEKPVGANAAAAGAAGGDPPTPGSALGPADSAGASGGTPKPSGVKSASAAAAAAAVGAGGVAGARSSSRAAPNIGLDEVRTHLSISSSSSNGRRCYARTRAPDWHMCIVPDSAVRTYFKLVLFAALKIRVHRWLNEGLSSTLYICVLYQAWLYPYIYMRNSLCASHCYMSRQCHVVLCCAVPSRLCSAASQPPQQAGQS